MGAAGQILGIAGHQIARLGPLVLLVQALSEK